MPSKNRKLFLTDHCLTPHENIPSSAILCEGDKIIATGGASAFVREPGLEIIALKGAYAVPGFIDSHVHGAGGFDASRALEVLGWKPDHSGAEEIIRDAWNWYRLDQA